jgi:hypothetical protein
LQRVRNIDEAREYLISLLASKKFTIQEGIIYKHTTICGTAQDMRLVHVGVLIHAIKINKLNEKDGFH